MAFSARLWGYVLEAPQHAAMSWTGPIVGIRSVDNTNQQLDEVEVVGKKKVSKLTRALLMHGALLSACAPSITLPQALSSSAPIELRRAQYNRYRVVRAHVAISLMPSSCGRYGCTSYPATIDSQLTLANGVVVSDPAELLPLVSRGSRTQTHAESARTFETAGIISYIAVLPLAAVGAGFLFGGGQLGWSMNTTLWVSIPILVLGGLSAITGGILRGFAAHDRLEAFQRFDDDFRNNLGLCEGPIERGECSPQSSGISRSLSRDSLPITPVGAYTLRF